MRRWVFGLLLLSVLAVFSWSAIYYVDYTGGSDSNNGLTTITAWKTISKVNSSYASYAPGDSILFKRGETWDVGTGNALRIRSSGSAGGGYITFGAYGSGAKPIISHNPTDGYSTIYIYDNDKSYINIEYLDIRSVTTGGLCFIGRSGCNHIKVQYCDVTNSVGVGLSARYLDTFEFSYNTISASTVGINIDGSATSKATNGWVHHNTVNGGTDCISIHDDSSGYDPGNNHIIEYNNVGLTSQPSENCIDMSFQTGEIIPPTGVIIRGNSCKGGGAGVLGLSGDGTIVEKNYVYYGGNSGWEGLVVGSGTVNMTVRYNIFTNGTGVSGAGILVGSSAPINGLNFYNNVVYNGSNGTRSTFSFSDVANTNIVIKNNVFINEVSGYYLMAYAGSRDPGTTSTTLDYNCYYSSSGSGSDQFYANGTAYNLADWKTTTSQEAVSFFSDPQFANTDDMQLLRLSPCINAGTNVNITNDFKGRRVPFGKAPDIGANEYTKSIMTVLRIL